MQPVVIRNDAELKETEADLSGYEGVTDASVFRAVSAKEAARIFTEKASGILFVSETDCLWCSLAAPVLQRAAQLTQTSVWYMDAAGKIKPEEYDTLCGFLTETFREDPDTGEKQFFIPAVIAVKDGTITAYHISLTDDFHSDEQQELTEEQSLALLQIYTELIASAAEEEQ